MYPLLPLGFNTFCLFIILCNKIMTVMATESEVGIGCIAVLVLLESPITTLVWLRRMQHPLWGTITWFNGHVWIFPCHFHVVIMWSLVLHHQIILPKPFYLQKGGGGWTTAPWLCPSMTTPYANFLLSAFFLTYCQLSQIVTGSQPPKNFFILVSFCHIEWVLVWKMRSGR